MVAGTPPERLFRWGFCCRIPHVTVERKAPARDEDLVWLFTCASAELGLSSIHGALINSAVPTKERVTRSHDGTHVKASPHINWSRERIVDRGIVRGKRESLPQHHVDAVKESRGESSIARHTRLTNCYRKLGQEDQIILFLAYGARPLGYQPVERVEEGARGVTLRSKLGRFSRVLAVTSAVRAGYNATLTRIEKVNATQKTLSGPFGPCRVIVPPSIDEWVESLASPAAPKSAAPVLKDARTEVEQIVSAAWNTWNTLRGDTRPVRKPRRPKIGVYQRTEEPLPWR